MERLQFLVVACFCLCAPLVHAYIKLINSTLSQHTTPFIMGAPTSLLDSDGPYQSVWMQYDDFFYASVRAICLFARVYSFCFTQANTTINWDSHGLPPWLHTKLCTFVYDTHTEFEVMLVSDSAPDILQLIRMNGKWNSWKNWTSLTKPAGSSWNTLMSPNPNGVNKTVFISAPGALFSVYFAFPSFICFFRRSRVAGSYHQHSQSAGYDGFDQIQQNQTVQFCAHYGNCLFPRSALHRSRARRRFFAWTNYFGPCGTFVPLCSVAFCRD